KESGRAGNFDLTAECNILFNSLNYGSITDAAVELRCIQPDLIRQEIQRFEAPLACFKRKQRIVHLPELLLSLRAGTARKQSGLTGKIVRPSLLYCFVAAAVERKIFEHEPHFIRILLNERLKVNRCALAVRALEVTEFNDG